MNATEPTPRATVVCAGPNLALERNQRLPELVPGEILRTTDSIVYAGGKGLNVARTVSILGHTAVAVTFAGGRLGAFTVALAESEGLTVEAVAVRGEVRSTALLLEDGGRVTVVNDAGPPTTEPDWQRFVAAVERQLVVGCVLVCSGSLPPGSPVDAYARLVRAAHRHTATVIVDATGPVLAAALEERPDVVVPNLFEAQAVLAGRTRQPSATVGDELAAQASDVAQALRGRGARSAIVTAGGLGLAVAAGDGAPQWLVAPAVSEVNPIGAGDALAGAMAVQLAQRRDLAGVARTAMAVASASVETRIPGHFDRQRAEEIAAGSVTPLLR